MKFTKESGLVQMWVRQIHEGFVTENQVPKLGNLRDAVAEALAADNAALVE